jgi:hypothetical protein
MEEVLNPDNFLDIITSGESFEVEFIRLPRSSIGTKANRSDGHCPKIRFVNLFFLKFYSFAS